MAERAFTAARGEFKVNSVVIAYCTGVNGTEIIARRAVRPIGTVVAVERPAVAVDVSLSANYVRLVDLDEVQQGIIGGRSTKDLLDEGEALLELFDTKNKKPIYVIEGAVPTSMSFSMMSGDVVSYSSTWEGRRMLRESEVA